MRDGIQKISHPLVRRPLPPVKRIARAGYRTVQQHIVRQQYSAVGQQTQYHRQPDDILCLRRVQKDKIKSPALVYGSRQIIIRIDMQGIYMKTGTCRLPDSPAFLYCGLDKGYIGKSLFVVGIPDLQRHDIRVRQGLSHDQRRVAHRSTYLQYALRAVYGQNRLEQLLAAAPDNGYILLLCAFPYLLQYSRITRTQTVQVILHRRVGYAPQVTVVYMLFHGEPPPPGLALPDAVSVSGPASISSSICLGVIDVFSTYVPGLISYSKNQH